MHALLLTWSCEFCSNFWIDHLEILAVTFPDLTEEIISSHLAISKQISSKSLEG